MTSLRLSRARACLLMGLFALIASACGGDSDGGNPDAATNITTTTVAAPQGEPIVVFISRNVDGGQSSFGPQSWAFVSAIEAQNKRGGINGRPLEAPFCDGKSDPNVEGACLTAGLARNPVVVANTIFRAPTGEKAANAFRERGMIQLGTLLIGMPAVPEGAPDLVPLSPGQVSSESSLIAMKELGLHTQINIVASRLGAAPLQLTPEQQARLDKAGVELLPSVEVDVTTADWAPTAQALKESDADVVTIGGIGAANEVKLLQAMEAINYKPMFTGQLMFSPQDLQVVAPILNNRFFGTTGTLPPDYTDHEEVQRFVEELEAGARAGHPWLDKPYTSLHMTGWVQAQAILAVLKTMKGEINPTTFAQATRDAKNLDMGGIVAPWTPFLDEDLKTDGKQTYASFYITTVKNGALTLKDNKLRCGKLDGCSGSSTTTTAK